MDEIKTITSQILDYIEQREQSIAQTKEQLKWLDDRNPDLAIYSNVKHLGAKETRRAIVFGNYPYVVSNIIVPDLVVAINSFLSCTSHWEINAMHADGKGVIDVSVVYKYYKDNEPYPGIVIVMTEDKSLMPPKYGDEESDD